LVLLISLNYFQDIRVKLHLEKDKVNPLWGKEIMSKIHFIPCFQHKELTFRQKKCKDGIL